MSVSRQHRPWGRIQAEQQHRYLAGTAHENAGGAGGSTAGAREVPRELDCRYRYWHGTIQHLLYPQPHGEEEPTAGGSHRGSHWGCCPRNAGGSSPRPGPSSPVPWPASSPSSSWPRHFRTCCSSRRSCSHRSRRSWPRTTTGADPTPAGRTSGPCRCPRPRFFRRALISHRHRTARDPCQIRHLHLRFRLRHRQQPHRRHHRPCCVAFDERKSGPRHPTHRARPSWSYRPKRPTRSGSAGDDCCCSVLLPDDADADADAGTMTTTVLLEAEVAAVSLVSLVSLGR